VPQRHSREVAGLTVHVVDHSLNLSSEPDERDLGFGFEVLPDGSIRQREPAAPADQPREERDS